MDILTDFYTNFKSFYIINIQTELNERMVKIMKSFLLRIYKSFSNKKNDEKLFTLVIDLNENSIESNLSFNILKEFLNFIHFTCVKFTKNFKIKFVYSDCFIMYKNFNLNIKLSTIYLLDSKLRFLKEICTKLNIESFLFYDKSSSNFEIVLDEILNIDESIFSPFVDFFKYLYIYIYIIILNLFM